MDEGPREAPVALLLHGFPDSSALWQNLVPALAAAGYRVLAPDMLGYGQSDKPQQAGEYTLKNTAAGLVQALDSLGVEKLAVVVGHDWGAAVAWRLTYTVPHRVQRLMVLSVGHPGGGTAAGGRRQRERWWYMLWFAAPGAVEALEGSPAAWVVLKDLLAEEPAAVREAYIAALKQPGALRGGLNWYRANTPPEVFMQAELREMPPVRCPVVGIWGSNDVALTEEQMVCSQRYCLPGRWQYRRWEGTGHWLPRDRPKDLEREVMALLASPGLDDYHRDSPGQSHGIYGLPTGPSQKPASRL